MSLGRNGPTFSRRRLWQGYLDRYAAVKYSEQEFPAKASQGSDGSGLALYAGAVLQEEIQAAQDMFLCDASAAAHLLDLAARSKENLVKPQQESRRLGRPRAFSATSLAWATLWGAIRVASSATMRHSAVDAFSRSLVPFGLAEALCCRVRGIGRPLCVRGTRPVEAYALRRGSSWGWA